MTIKKQFSCREMELAKYLLSEGKRVHFLARGERTAKEIRQLAEGKFVDFMKLKKRFGIQEMSKKRGDMRNISSTFSK